MAALVTITQQQTMSKARHKNAVSPVNAPELLQTSAKQSMMTSEEYLLIVCSTDKVFFIDEGHTIYTAPGKEVNYHL